MKRYTTKEAARELRMTRAWAVVLLRRVATPAAAPGGGFMWTQAAVERVREMPRPEGRPRKDGGAAA